MNRNRKDLGNLILKKKVYIVLITFIFMVTGITYTLTNVNYIASQKILINGENTDLIHTYQEIAKGSMTLETVIRNLDLKMSTQELASCVEVSNVEHTNMLEIRVFGENEQQTQNISNEISKVLIATVNEIYGTSNLYQVDQVADYYTNGNTVIVAICAGIAGLLLSCFVFVMGFLLDTKIKSCKDIEELTGLKALISIPNIKLIAKKRLNIKNIREHKSEVFKTLMTNIQFVNANHAESKSIVVSSANPLEGKTYVAINLAIEFAKAGKKVILIDGDMRRGRIAKIFNLPNDLGFSNYLSHLDSNGNNINERITRFIHDTEIKNLNVITSGNIPPNPMELLGTDRVEELMKDLKIFYDMILFDTVSLLHAPEAKKLSEMCDLTLIVSAYGKTKKEELMAAYGQVNRTAENCIGMAFNKIPETKLKKKIANFKNSAKSTISKWSQSGKVIIKKIGKMLRKLDVVVSILKKVGVVAFIGLVKLKNGVVSILHKLKGKSQDVKEYIQKYKSKREKTRLIEAGSVPNDEQSNIIKEVFENEIAKLEMDESEYKKKLDGLKANIEVKNPEIPKVRPVAIKPENQEKSKFDLIREQRQQKEIQGNEVIYKSDESKPEENKKEVEKEQPRVVELKTEEKQIEQLEKRQEIENHKKEEEKRIRKEKIENYEEVDLSRQEDITEEMIRKQVEMDELVRLAEKEEEEEALMARRMKQDKRIRRKKEYKEKIKNFFNFTKDKEEQEVRDTEEERIHRMEVKVEQKIIKEQEKSENKAKTEKDRDEKRAYKEIEKQRQKEELRIREELQEDNLYPKPKL